MSSFILLHFLMMFNQTDTTTAPLPVSILDDFSFSAQSHQFQFVAYLISTLLLVWVIGMVNHLRKMVVYYNENYGLSEDEWKMVSPEMYAKDEKEKADLLAKKAEMIQAAGENTNHIQHLLNPPTENPHKNDSFGLPPGTIRGVIALTILILFVGFEILNLFSTINLETRFSELITAFQMIIAFYFGSKAIDVLKIRSEKKENATPATQTNTVSSVNPNPAPAVIEVVDSTIPEHPAMPSRDEEKRRVNIVENNPSESKKKESKLTKKTPLSERVLALTASFETGKSFPQCFAGISGDFDGQGMSYGALQWNIGRKSLQPLWQKMLTENEETVKTILGEKFDSFSSILKLDYNGQLSWARSIQSTKMIGSRKVWRIEEEWKNPLQTLALTPEMIAIQVGQANDRYTIALANCKYFKLKSERAVALMFDINVQNGKIGVKGAGTKIWQDYANLPTALDEVNLEIERMKIISNRRADVSTEKWRADVRSRKLTIATGSGIVHHKNYDVEKDYLITMNNAKELS